MNDKFETPKAEGYPLLPMRGLSVFPDMLINFDVVRDRSVAALDVAMRTNRIVFIVAQKDISKEFPEEDDLYSVGTLCLVKQLLRIPGTDGIRVLVEGIQRARLIGFTSGESYCFAEVERIEESAKHSPVKAEALIRQCVALFDDYFHLVGSLPPEMLAKSPPLRTPDMLRTILPRISICVPTKSKSF